jgi:hypothetical protein
MVMSRRVVAAGGALRAQRRQRARRLRARRIVAHLLHEGV